MCSTLCLISLISGHLPFRSKFLLNNDKLENTVSAKIISFIHVINNGEIHQEHGDLFWTDTDAIYANWWRFLALLVTNIQSSLVGDNKPASWSLMGTCHNCFPINLSLRVKHRSLPSSEMHLHNWEHCTKRRRFKSLLTCLHFPLKYC